MICLETFNLEKLDIEGKHYGLVQGMSIDNKVKLYIDRNLFEWLAKHQAVSEDRLEVGKIYAIIKDGKEVGIVGSLEISDDGILNVVYAIKKNARDKGYGKKILEEVTFYYLENIKGIKGIKLTIDGLNKGSKRIAEVNGYINRGIEKETGLEEWYYDRGDELSRKIK